MDAIWKIIYDVKWDEDDITNGEEFVISAENDETAIEYLYEIKGDGLSGEIINIQSCNLCSLV